MQYEVFGDFPAWWGKPYLIAFSDERVDLVNTPKEEEQ
jgi:hypothetical protein